MSAPSYPVGTLREMCAIPEEALPRFLAELPTIIAEARRAYAAMDAITGLDLGVEMIPDGSPNWIDDDLDQFTFATRFKGDEAAFTLMQKRGDRP